jgi:hypothetical protein
MHCHYKPVSTLAAVKSKWFLSIYNTLPEVTFYWSDKIVILTEQHHQKVLLCAQF